MYIVRNIRDLSSQDLLCTPSFSLRMKGGIASLPWPCSWSVVVSVAVGSRISVSHVPVGLLLLHRVEQKMGSGMWMKGIGLLSSGQKHLSEKGQARPFLMRSHSFALGMMCRGILAFIFKGAVMGGDIFPISVNVTKEVATGLFPTGCDCPFIRSHSHCLRSRWCALKTCL